MTYFTHIAAFVAGIAFARVLRWAIDKYFWGM